MPKTAVHKYRNPCRLKNYVSGAAATVNNGLVNSKAHPPPVEFGSKGTFSRVVSLRNVGHPPCGYRRNRVGERYFPWHCWIGSGYGRSHCSSLRPKGRRRMHSHQKSAVSLILVVIFFTRQLCHLTPADGPRILVFSPTDFEGYGAAIFVRLY
jgi:hypothetical protein